MMKKLFVGLILHTYACIFSSFTQNHLTPKRCQALENIKRQFLEEEWLSSLQKLRQQITIENQQFQRRKEQHCCSSLCRYKHKTVQQWNITGQFVCLYAYFTGKTIAQQEKKALQKLIKKQNLQEDLSILYYINPKEYDALWNILKKKVK